MLGREVIWIVLSCLHAAERGRALGREYSLGKGMEGGIGGRHLTGPAASPPSGFQGLSSFSVEGIWMYKMGEGGCKSQGLRLSPADRILESPWTTHLVLALPFPGT
uniref:Uncharacterized protein n=1 Tax=Salvator merianae TaxID=96440 RepID=A0A8D0ATF7_SALMN